MHHILRPGLLDEAATIRERFECAVPFRHAIIEGFFEAQMARDLLERFPSPSNASANPYGAPGRKAFHSDLGSLPQPYPAVHAFFGSREFLDWIEQATGIPGLLYDESNFGGGTHENFDGRDLRPHVDFNFHPVTKLHRRLNLIVYLNEDWDVDWGGSIALHSDPRSSSNTVTEYAPSFNRCIIFETSERSWHGFETIALPSGQKHRSRKSLSIYLYSRERAEEDIYGEHTTFFVPRPLPPHFVGGRTLTTDDMSELEELIGHRDRLIELYQNEQRKRTDQTLETSRLRIRVSELEALRTLPSMGYVLVENVRGVYSDGWGRSSIEFDVVPERAVTGIRLRFRTPPGLPDASTLTVSVDGREAFRKPIAAGFNEIEGRCPLVTGVHARLGIASSATTNPKRLGVGADERDLGLFLERVIFEHGSGV